MGGFFVGGNNTFILVKFSNKRKHKEREVSLWFVAFEQNAEDGD